MGRRPRKDRLLRVIIKVNPESTGPTRGSGGHRLTVHLTSSAYLKAYFVRCGRPYRSKRFALERGDDASFDVVDPAELQRDAVRRTLTRFPYLLPAERDAVLRLVGEGVPEAIARAVRRRAGDTFRVKVSVLLGTVHTEEDLMVMAFRVKAAAAAGVLDGGETPKCAICLDGLSGGGAVELTGCRHAFHRRCFSGWFSRQESCPLCRADVWENLESRLRHSALFSYRSRQGDELQRFLKRKAPPADDLPEQ